jgi:cell fate (sporulation/competence/biofilm development) regulator YmcA (YheA/YmcA/DUF963 family)
MNRYTIEYRDNETGLLFKYRTKAKDTNELVEMIKRELAEPKHTVLGWIRVK